MNQRKDRSLRGFEERREGSTSRRFRLLRDDWTTACSLKAATEDHRKIVQALCLVMPALRDVMQAVLAVGLSHLLALSHAAFGFASARARSMELYRVPPGYGLVASVNRLHGTPMRIYDSGRARWLATVVERKANEVYERRKEDHWKHR